MPAALNLDVLNQAVAGTAAAFRCVTEYQPAGGVGDKVFPPTYEGGQYATEQRRLPDRPELVDCVLLDSVQSQANRMELALLEAWEAERIPLPVVTVDFQDASLEKPLRITSLEAPHRIADALLRDSLHGGKPFRKSALGARLDQVDLRNATALFELCPTALVFGIWDSTGPKGGLGAKFARALVSEIVGIDVQPGVKTSSRIDPAQIQREAATLYKAKATENSLRWTLDHAQAEKDRQGQPVKLGKKGGKPSEANHGNVTPSLRDPKSKQPLPGGFTLTRALQTTVLSLPALRRLRFPLDGARNPATDESARTALAALGLCAAALVREQGCDLRSRCLLVPTEPAEWELLDRPGEEPRRFSLPASAAVEVYREAVAAARAAGLPWLDEELVLMPAPDLVKLVRKSQELAAQFTAEEDEAT